MLEFAGITFRYFELGVYASLLLLTGLMFVKSRPPGFVWIGVVTMGSLGAHLFVEHGRWQLVPVYTLAFLMSIVVAVPSRRRYRVGGLILRLAIVVFLVLPALAMAYVVPVFSVPDPSGPYQVGTAQLQFSRSVQVSAWYPARIREDVVAPYWSRDDVLNSRLPGFSRVFSSHLNLVPTNSFVRAELADGVLPILLFFVGDEALPAESLLFAEQAASVGWFVVELPVNTTPDLILQFLSGVADGTLDTAFASALDRNRVVAFGLRVNPPAGLGLPAITVGGRTLFGVQTASATYGIDAPELSIPHSAIGSRYLLVRPSRVLVGASDLPPDQLNRLLLSAFSAVLGTGELSSPVFTGTDLADSLGTARRMFAEVQGLSISPTPE